MESNIQTTNENIFNTAIQLADIENYQELDSTDRRLDCDFLIINHQKKQFFFTKSSTENHLQKLINSKKL